MSKTANRVVKNTGYLYAGMAISLFMSLYTTRLILNALGASDYGIYGIVGGAIALLGFLNGSMTVATQRFMSYTQGEKNIQRQKEIFNNSIRTSHIYWIAFVLVYIVDGGCTILHRIILRENILLPHKKHAYQIMANELRMPHLAVSGIYMTIQGLICIWFIAIPSNTTLFIQITILSTLYLVFMKRYYKLHKKN